MIISHKYKYVFIQLDQTASTAIAQELCENYDGQKILWKHARYCDFMKVASPEEKEFFFFSGIRNPLDTIVSLYFKIKERPRFKDLSNPNTTKENFRQAIYLENNNADFSDFFQKFYACRIYNEWKTRDFEKLDYIYRFENIQAEFSSILKHLNLIQIRPLPLINETPGRKKDYASYYDNERVQRDARIAMGKFMKKWNYGFPSGWAELRIEDYARYLWLASRHIVTALAYSAADDTGLYRKYIIRSDKMKK